MYQNKQFRLASRPVGRPQKETWNFVTEEIAAPQEGQVLIKTLYISLDPAMRGWMNDAKSYLPPVGIDEVMRAFAVGKVLASGNAGFQEGDFVVGPLGVQEYCLSDGRGLNKVDPNVAPLPLYLSTLGATGMTAYFGLLDIGQPKEGETVVVSGAAGAVGSMVGQIARLKGCRVIGIAGGAEKCAYVTKELGFDACIDYKNEQVAEALEKNCPDGVDIYFDNVGGEILDAVLKLINIKARVVLCGAISQYNEKEITGPKNYLTILTQRARMEGFIIIDYMNQFEPAAVEMAQWMAQGKLKGKEHIVEGLETFPATFMMLFDGKNQGKLLLKVADA